jgi:hypothetical protein
MTYTPPPRDIPNLRRVKPKGGRARWRDNDGNIYEWDGQHATLEKYDPRGRHLGELSWPGLEPVELAKPNRSVEP